MVGAQDPLRPVILRGHQVVPRLDTCSQTALHAGATQIAFRPGLLAHPCARSPVHAYVRENKCAGASS